MSIIDPPDSIKLFGGFYCIRKPLAMRVDRGLKLWKERTSFGRIDAGSPTAIKSTKEVSIWIMKA